MKASRGAGMRGALSREVGCVGVRRRARRPSELLLGPELLLNLEAASMPGLLLVLLECLSVRLCEMPQR